MITLPASLRIYLPILVVSLTVLSCYENIEKDMPHRDINTVKEAHAAELMAIRGVVGVYVGKTEDGGDCIYVMVAELTLEIRRQIPVDIEGHAVLIEESGEIIPMKK